jgi:hypothetical protein
LYTLVPFPVGVAVLLYCLPSLTFMQSNTASVILLLLGDVFVGVPFP